MTAVITEAAITDGAESDFVSPYKFDFTKTEDGIRVHALVPMIGPILMGRFWEGGNFIAPGGSGKLLGIAERQWKADHRPSVRNP